MDHLKMYSISAANLSYTNFIKDLENNPFISDEPAIFVQATEENVIEFCKKIN